MRLSRSKIELYIECPRCFYLDVVMKVPRPSSYPLNLNNTVDMLLRREFDSYRKQNVAHPIQSSISGGFKPARLNELEVWRNIRQGGLSHYYEKYNCTFFGEIDDLWVNEHEVYAVVDYKATSKETPVTELPTWATSYYRQLSFYGNLLEMKGLRMHSSGFIVYATASRNEPSFANRLLFDTNLIELALDYSWIEPTLDSIFNLMESKELPNYHEACRYCSFIRTSLRI